VRQDGAVISEFESLREVAAELGLPEDAIPPVRRIPVQVGDGTALSALVWGTAALVRHPRGDGRT
jgi:alkylhydroperoxidase family enzyme